MSTFVVKFLSMTYLYLGQRGCSSLTPYFSDPTNSTCVTQCPITHTQTPSSFICQACSAPCNECYALTSNCTACASGYTLGGNTCTRIVVACPAGQTQDPVALVC